MWEKTTVVVVSVFKLINIKNFLHSCTSAGSRKYASTHLLKAKTFTHSLAPTIREVQPPNMITNYYLTQTTTTYE